MCTLTVKSCSVFDSNGLHKIEQQFARNVLYSNGQGGVMNILRKQLHSLRSHGITSRPPSADKNVFVEELVNAGNEA